MRKRRVFLILIAAAVVMCVGVLVFGWFREREPEYGGKKLSEWVEACTLPVMFRENKEAAEAIRHMGTNALPYLLKWIRYETRPWRANLFRVVKPIERLSGTSYFRDSKQRLRAMGAMRALVVLGPKAEGATVELSRIMNEPGANISAARTLFVLTCLGKNDAVLAFITNNPTKNLNILGMADELRLMGTNARPAIPVLQHLVQDPSVQVRVSAIDALIEIDR